jgi:polysaccharide pyruvyl transferase WcaK-like protein
VLIGGGQLLMDNDLVFPLKVWEIVRIAHDLDKIVTFYACGVGKKWSRLGLHLLARALFDENVMGVSVRDNGSRDILRALFPNAKFAIDLAIDPAVCAAEAYKINADPDSNIIGLNISAPHVLKKRVSGTKSTFAVKRFRQFWLDLAEILTCDHRQFVLFTNGQVEDYAFAQHIAAEIYSKKKMKQVYLLKRPLDPRILTSQIAQFRAIVAHRLHANIIAYSMGIPSVGLIWDKKVEEFGKMTERSNFYLDPTHMDPWIVKQCLYDAMSVGVDPLRLAYNKAFALRSVHTMLSLTGIKPNRRFLDL